MDRKVRLGIDVGGTFTDAVAIDNDTYEIIGKVKVPTTHHAAQGVALGIVEAIHTVLTDNQIRPEEVVFIAHGTTQATNALLEGDVAKVGILGMGSGLEAGKSKNETNVGDIELAKNKFLHTFHSFLDPQKASTEDIKSTIMQLKNQGAEVIVASEAYSVDNSENERKVIEIASNLQTCATGGYEISQLYGLSSRTRTAVVNASLIPKMMETANMTEESVQEAEIKKPLMIMRCDGGVMSVDEVKKRPILTMLSGLAAGVAGALMYEKITDGIFLEVGGTSTDISVIKDGKVMIKNAQVGGHKLYLTSLDVRTLGVAGGSMIIVENDKIVDVGPRSAHIACMEYECFTNEDEMSNPEMDLIAPRAEDKAHYAIVRCDNEKSFALTLAGAANLLGYVPKGDYAYGNLAATQKAWEALARRIGCTVTEACQKVVEIAGQKLAIVVKELMSDYDLNANIIRLVGGGGSASIVTPFLGEQMGLQVVIAKNAPYISTIGVALALVREQLERNVSNPDENDIKRIRMDLLDRIIKAGANPDTVEIAIEIDSQKNILRAIGTGATELRTKDLASQKKNMDELQSIVQAAVPCEAEDIKQVVTVGRWNGFLIESVQKSFWGLRKSKKRCVRIVDEEGVIRLQKEKADMIVMEKSKIASYMEEFIENMIQYTDAGARLPKTFMFYKQKSIDLSGVLNLEQLISLAKMEIELLADDEKILLVAAKEG